MFLCQPFADYCCTFHVFPTVRSISHTRSRYQGTDERLPTVRRAQAGEPAWPPVVTACCPSSSQAFVIYTLAVRLKMELA